MADPQPNYIEPKEEPTNIISTGGGSVMKGGSFESPNFDTGKSGWALKADGTIEARKLKVGQVTVSVAAGADINEQIEWLNDNGGGIIYLASGTHTLTEDLTFYSNIELRGQTAEDTTINFASAAYQIKAVGSTPYTTGTVTATNGSGAIVGSGTTWTASMVGQSIMLGGLYYTIGAFTDTTHITLTTGLVYAGSDLSGATYVICTPITGCKISNLKITSSATACIKIQYAREVFLFDIDLQASVIALDIDDSENISLKQIDYVYTISDAIQLNNCHFTEIQGSGGINAGGNGVTMNGCTKIVFLASFFENSTGDNMNLTSCVDIGIVQVSTANSVNGIELVSGCDNVSILNCTIKGNSSDGIKLTATDDRNIVNGCAIEDNGGYGINIAAATCDSNVVTSNSYNNNTSGDINDSGTGTIQAESKLYELVVSNNLKASADTERNNINAAYTKIKEIKVRVDGTIRIKFDLKSAGAITNAYGKIYLNGVAAGTERTNLDTYTTYSEDIAISKDDLVQLYTYSNPVNGDYCRNFRLYWNKDVVADYTVNTD